MVNGNVIPGPDDAFIIHCPPDATLLPLRSRGKSHKVAIDTMEEIVPRLFEIGYRRRAWLRRFLHYGSRQSLTQPMHPIDKQRKVRLTTA